MADLLVSASTGAMGTLLMKLGTLLSDEWKALKDVRDDIEALKKELEAMLAFLLVMADVEEPDEQAKLRVRDVRELSYDIEDNIDKFMVLVGRESNPTTQGFKILIDKCKKVTNGIKIRRQIAKEVKSINNQVKEVSERYARYKIDEACTKTRKSVVDSRVLAIFKDASELVGIEGPRDELMKWLKHEEESESGNQLRVVSIVGFGGLGKTTLANQVYNKIGANFNCRAFVSISRNPDMTKVLGSILSEISNQNVIPAGTPEVIITQIREFLHDKRYFIVADDIWDVQTLQVLKYAFLNNSCGSRLLITTRIMDVAKFCSSSDNDLVYQIQPLSFVDSKVLFFKRIFGCEEKCPPNLREASNEILKKCGGLPLAIIAISSLLATRQTKDQWDRVRTSIGFAFGKSSEVDGMRGILSLSYFELPLRLRSCLLYLAQYPEDYEIGRTRLVHRWIGEGFIHAEDGQDLAELGDMYFHELVNRSLVQPLWIGYDGKAGGCRVHDTILDFLIHKSAEENFCSLLSNWSKLPELLETKVRRLTLLGTDSEGHVNISTKLNTSHLRSLCVFGSSKQMPSVVEFNSLRVLDLESTRGLENHHLQNIGRLSQLRYLNIAYTGITELPTSIGCLQYLETLNVEVYGLAELPEAVTRLKRLVRMIISPDTVLPDGIGMLNNLQELGTDIDVSKCSLNFLQGVGELTNLRRLSIQWYTDNLKGDEACRREKLVSSLHKLEACSLRELSLASDGEDTFFPALNSIRRVILRRPVICKVVNWLASLVNLEYLHISVGFTKMKQQDLELIGSIPTLLFFSMNLSESCDMGAIIIRRGLFQQLHTFSFACISKYNNGFMVEEGAMPMVKQLDLTIDPVKFKSATGGFDFGIQHLSCLVSVSLWIYMQANDEDVEAAAGAFKSMVETHTNRPTLEICPRRI